MINFPATFFHTHVQQSQSAFPSTAAFATAKSPHGHWISKTGRCQSVFRNFKRFIPRDAQLPGWSCRLKSYRGLCSFHVKLSFLCASRFQPGLGGVVNKLNFTSKTPNKKTMLCYRKKPQKIFPDSERVSFNAKSGMLHPSGAWADDAPQGQIEFGDHV